MDATLVVGPRRACRRGDYRHSTACVMPAVAASVPALRRFAVRTARRCGLLDDVAEALALIVTELVTNAVRHSGSPDVTLLLCVADGDLTVQVSDTGRWRRPTAPPASEPGAREPGPLCGGRGLLLVEAYAASCAVQVSRSGTTVTAELRLPPKAAAHPLTDPLQPRVRVCAATP
ncbi:ATP-binding protein [Streptacidiphilus pinicola]|uniref:ATP-binding protein n=1 Tax=Streptacidiphilus pinicola TaxID=2219663 RepID=A0A2X0IPY9_9ACTN|nr:ATP-binding protein [Streptacidiphilus pinicola]RAG87282.1 ATP-binding protein [Streptacidiphilus pinicola]